MANTFNPKSNTWTIDTPGVIMTGNIKVKAIRWNAADAAEGDEAIVTNSSGTDPEDRIWSSIASGALHIDEQLIEDWWHDGFQVATLDSGYLEVDLR